MEHNDGENPYYVFFFLKDYNNMFNSSGNKIARITKRQRTRHW
jgi:hypothetical protein